MNLKVNDIQKHIDKIILEIKTIDAKAQAPVAKPTAAAPKPAEVAAPKLAATAADLCTQRESALEDELAHVCVALTEKGRRLEAKNIHILDSLEAKRIHILDDLEASLAKVESLGLTSLVETDISAKNDHETSHDLLEFTVGYSFLSNAQLAQKYKEYTECQTELCKIGKQAKWAITDLAQGTSFAAGIVAGVPAGLYETVDEIVKTVSNPAEAYSALKTLSDNGNILGSLTSAVKQSWVERIDSMEAEYQKGSISGAFNAGVEGGKLTADIGGLLTGGAGLVKSGVVATEKAVAKAASKANSVVKTGADMALPQASTTERIAGYMAPKVVPDTSEAARLALISSPFLTMKPLENPFLGKVLVERLALSTPQQTKVAEQLLDIGIKASVTGITAITLKDVADRITADELNHITALSTVGNRAMAGDYLSSLQDKYAPAHTGNTRLPDTTLRNTAGSQPLVPQAPNHTGNNQVSGQGVTHTGNTAGVTDSGIKTTITPIPDRPSMDDLAYLAGSYKPNKGAVGNMGEFFTQPGFGSEIKELSVVPPEFSLTA